ncbi:unnamed protein product [Protopolystoma xenopodis]|uniref:Uncharacterized protein n=1 Tax=Protopolystoma xenopodis TaxID=117903 RepID=A0A448WGV1_9PLAT|nr:unnamed protein product [Protopolystoma xenopodis]
MSSSSSNCYTSLLASKDSSINQPSPSAVESAKLSPVRLYCKRPGDQILASQISLQFPKGLDYTSEKSSFSFVRDSAPLTFHSQHELNVLTTTVTTMVDPGVTEKRIPETPVKLSATRELQEETGENSHKLYVLGSSKENVRTSKYDSPSDLAFSRKPDDELIEEPEFIL